MNAPVCAKERERVRERVRERSASNSFIRFPFVDAISEPFFLTFVSVLCLLVPSHPMN